LSRLKILTMDAYGWHGLLYLLMVDHVWLCHVVPSGSTTSHSPWISFGTLRLHQLAFSLTNTWCLWFEHLTYSLIDIWPFGLTNWKLLLNLLCCILTLIKGFVTFENVNYGWLWLAMFDYGLIWFIIFNYGWPCLTMVWLNCGWPC
jgi:hypothetical protein